MVSAAVLCLAVLCWPTRPTSTRLHTLRPPARPRWRRRPPRPGAVTLTCASVVVGWLIAGPLAAAAAALTTATAMRRWRARGDHTRSLTATEGIADATRSLVAALRAGAHPADAAESAAEDAHPSAAGPMRAIAAAARLDGDLDRAMRTAATGLPTTLPTVLARLSRAWALAQRHGLPLADVLDAVVRDLDQRVRFTRRVLANMAGPRTSATVLTVLPALGIAIGQLIGANPLHVLTATPAGRVMLLLGAVFLCAGIAWCARLTNQAVAR
ncbi:type II secretion system F family protein [Actinophytocola sediminis]